MVMAVSGQILGWINADKDLHVEPQNHGLNKREQIYNTLFIIYYFLEHAEAAH